MLINTEFPHHPELSESQYNPRKNNHIKFGNKIIYCSNENEIEFIAKKFKISVDSLFLQQNQVYFKLKGGAEICFDQGLVKLENDPEQEKIVPGTDLRTKTIWQFINKDNDLVFDPNNTSQCFRDYVNQKNKYFNDAEEVYHKKYILGRIDHCLVDNINSGNLRETKYESEINNLKRCSFQVLEEILQQLTMEKQSEKSEEKIKLLQELKSICESEMRKIDVHLFEAKYKFLKDNFIRVRNRHKEGIPINREWYKGNKRLLEIPLKEYELDKNKELDQMILYTESKFRKELVDMNDKTYVKEFEYRDLLREFGCRISVKSPPIGKGPSAVVGIKLKIEYDYLRAKLK